MQINTTINTGSTGRIVEEIGHLIISQGHKSYVAYGRGNRLSESIKIKIGNKFYQANHLIQTRLFDRHGFASRNATKSFVKHIVRINPDVIHLHNLHGYYLHIEVLFNYLKEINKPVVWTLHDCWAFTGHCSYFDRVECNRWETECFDCPNKLRYPSSIFIDNSRNNFQKKKELFNIIDRLIIVTPSKWLFNHVKKSFLSNFPVIVINNGVNLNLFIENHEIESQLMRKYNLERHQFVLGVASIWDERKGFNDLLKLRNKLNKNINIVVVGISKKQINNLPQGIIGINRTEDVKELAAFYSSALTYINPTYTDNFPTTNIEALSCGTPVITYKTGGSPEAIDNQTGFVLDKGDINGINEAVNSILQKGKINYQVNCRIRAERYYNKDDRFQDYLDLYENILRN